MDVCQPSQGLHWDAERDAYITWSVALEWQRLASVDVQSSSSNAPE